MKCLFIMSAVTNKFKLLLTVENKKLLKQVAIIYQHYFLPISYLEFYAVI